LNSPEHVDWMEACKPVPDRWDELVEFEDEWTREELLKR